ncbi:unnamed protein product [Bubo scandiacus]
MSVSKLQDLDEVFDFTAVVPETPRLDTSLQKARARLLAKGRRHRPSRSRLRDSASSTEGDEGPEAAGAEGDGGPRPPRPSPAAPSSPSRRGRCGGRWGTPRLPRPPQPLPAPHQRLVPGGAGGHPLAQILPQLRQLARLRPPRRPAPAAQRRRQPGHEPPEPASPTVGLDKKTRRKFLDLGVTLRRASSSKSRKEKGSNRLSIAARGARPRPGSASPTGSPRHEGLSPAKSASQDSTLSEDSPPPSASPRLPGPTTTKCSYPYHTLSQSSDEFLDEPPGAAAGWTCRQVGQWLESLNLEQYVEEFSAHGVDGPRLLHLDGAKLKALGVGSSQDRAVLKRKLKELSLAVEKERKAQEKAEKQREKQKKKDQEQRRS